MRQEHPNWKFWFSKESVFFCLLASYLAIRVPLIGLWTLTVGPVSPGAGEAVDLILFLLICGMVLVKHAALAPQGIDRISFVLILAFSVITRFFTLPVGQFNSVIWACFLIAATAVWTVISLNRSTVFAASGRVWSDVLLGFGVGILFAAIAVAPMVAFGRGQYVFSQLGRLAPGLISSFVRSMAYGAVLEEPIFRGFLVGFLRQRGWSANRTVVAQAVIFAGAHPWMITRPYHLLVVLPGLGMALGLLRLRQKNTIACLVAHAAYGALVTAPP